MGEKQDNEETCGLEGGYLTDRGISRHSIDFHKGKLGENSSDESKGERKKKGNTLMGRIKGIHHCLRDQE
jgi:hypothetical protein